MVKENKKDARSDNGFATSKQKELIKQLYKETGYKRQYSDIDLNGLYNVEAQKHIDFLLGYKRAKLNGNNAEKKANGFDKISFSMIYKLVWKYCGEHPNPVIREGKNFQKLVAMEYEQYIKTLNYVKKIVEKEAVQ